MLDLAPGSRRYAYHAIVLSGEWLGVRGNYRMAPGGLTRGHQVMIAIANKVGPAQLFQRLA